ncbi:MAG: MATE family efflux transporter [Clostridiales bacterium]|nr:MATE family efflux transporter [Clostridiales bacterium]
MLKTENKNFYKNFFIMLVTIAMQNMLVYGVNLADNIMLGSYSELAMSGASLVNQIQFLLQMLIGGVGDGIIVIASRHWGEGDVGSVKRASSVGMRWGLAFAAVMLAAALFFPTQALGILTNKADLIEEAARYLGIIGFTYPIFALTNILLATLRSVETTRIGFFISLSTLITNVALNYILIFGNFGAPEMGIRGAATATLISRIIELVIVTIYAVFADRKLHLRLRDFFINCGDMPKRFLKTSVPVILSGASWGIAMGLQTAILGRLDNSVVPANSIAATVFSLVTVFIYGSASASSVVLGKSIGENKKAVSAGIMTSEENFIDIKNKSRILQIVYLALGIITAAVLFVLKGFIIRFYDISPETALLADRFMCVLCVTVIGTAYQMPALSGIVRAGGDTGFVFRNDLIFMWGIVLPSSFAAAFLLKLDPVIVFLCLKSDQILKCAVAAVKVNRFKWIRDI